MGKEFWGLEGVLQRNLWWQAEEEYYHEEKQAEGRSAVKKSCGETGNKTRSFECAKPQSQRCGPALFEGDQRISICKLIFQKKKRKKKKKQKKSPSHSVGEMDSFF